MKQFCKLKFSNCLLLLSLLPFLFLSCKGSGLEEFDFPLVFTDSYEVVDLGSVTLKAHVDISEQSNTIEKGFLWSDDRWEVVNIGPNVNYLPGESTGDNRGFQATLSGLALNETYHFRAYAVFTDDASCGQRKVYSDSAATIKFSLGIELTLRTDLTDRVNNHLKPVSEISGIGQYGITVEEHGYTYSSTNYDPKPGQNNTGVIILGKKETDGRFEDTIIPNLAFNTLYYYRSWARTVDSIYYFSEVGEYTIGDGWLQKSKSDLPFIVRDAVAMSLGGKGYLIPGCQALVNTQPTYEENMIFEYDTESEMWTGYHLPNSYVFTRNSAIGFTIEPKLYFGLGRSNENGGALQELYSSASPSSASWKKIDDDVPFKLISAVAFVQGGKAYIGTGRDVDNDLINNFWEYDPSDDTFTPMPSLPVIFYPGGEEKNIGRMHAIAFTSQGFGYVGGGEITGGIKVKDLWKFNPPSPNNSTGHWDHVGFFPEDFIPRTEAIAFSIGDAAAFVGLGTSQSAGRLNDLWEFNPNLSGEAAWTRRTPFQGGGRSNAVAFVIGNTAYVGTGVNNENEVTNDFWMYIKEE